MSKQTSLMKQNLPLIILVVLLTVFPLIYLAGTDAEFGGADGAAEEMIGEINPEYEPWFESFWEPSGETESLLFALQAAIGSGIIFYAFGYWKGRLKGREDSGQKMTGKAVKEV